MSGTRFARTGRCRFLVCLGILVLTVGMVAIFHSSQVQLDETREQRLHCEQQQETLNERLTTLVEEKYHLERNQKRERKEQLETKRSLEQKIKELEEKIDKERIEHQVLYDKLKQTYTLLQSEHKHFKEEREKTNKQQLDNINGLEKKLHSIRSEFEKEKSNKSGELLECREKYRIAEQENKRLLNTIPADNAEMHQRIKELEDNIKDYQSHCDYKAVDISDKLVAPKPGRDNPSTSEKSFKHQEPVSEGVYHISVNITNYNNKTHNGKGVTASIEPSNAHIVPKSVKRIADDEPQQQEKPNRQVSQENDKNQVAPLSAPKNKGQLSSSPAAKSEQQMQAASIGNATSANVRTARGSSTSSSNLPPLAMPPPNERKIPENVAPIPEDFEDLLQKSNNDALKSNDDPPRFDDNLNNDWKESKNGSPLKSALNNNNINYDSGAHEIKDAFGEGDSNNMQHDGDINNFFDADEEAKNHNKNNNNKDLNDNKDDDGGNNDDDDDGLGLVADNDGGSSILGGAAAGDIAVKKYHEQKLLDEGLKNEVADDQGKEFGDGLRLDEGAIEEDDDDDYSNPSARKQAGGQAIRN